MTTPIISFFVYILRGEKMREKKSFKLKIKINLKKLKTKNGKKNFYQGAKNKINQD
jgi:hypothetical protein